MDTVKKKDMLKRIDNCIEYKGLQKKAAIISKRIRGMLDDPSEFDEFVEVTIQMQMICLELNLI